MTAPVARAVAAVRAGRPVRIAGGPAILPIETATDAMLDLLDTGGTAPLLASGNRAAALGLGNARAAADRREPARIARAPWLDRAAAVRLADPSEDFARGPIGPLEALPSGKGDAAALRLLTLAGLLPAAFIVETDALVVSGDDIENARRTLVEVSRATLPIGDAASAQMIAFRDAAAGDAHVALLVGGGFGGRAPLIRVHDECLTGDVFGSLKCDCGPQLHAAIHAIEADGGGLLLYLRQEGRGIGIANKLRAYALQDRGLDTVDANRRLGFADDERDFGLAAAMLRALKIDAVRLMTNNPRKVEGLEAEGIAVERVPHRLPTNPHNAHYIETKKKRSGHLD
ncbi:GTP cyclohydrolase II [Sphingomicrobium sp. XHP0235]|uniref:GTP cyclohydrolase II n=1 Tax=Sphingomicrobium aquimarinum TaxID=3133971 RepID=UPI0031FF12A0